MHYMHFLHNMPVYDVHHLFFTEFISVQIRSLLIAGEPLKTVCPFQDQLFQASLDKRLNSNRDLSFCFFFSSSFLLSDALCADERAAKSGD